MKVSCIKGWLVSNDCNGTEEVLTSALVVGADIFPLPVKARVDRTYLKIEGKNYKWTDFSQTPAEIKKLVQECSCCASAYNVRTEQFLDVAPGTSIITLSEVANEIILVLRSRTAEYRGAEWTSADNQNIELAIEVGDPNLNPGQTESFIVVYK
jgi:hypothetical protein